LGLEGPKEICVPRGGEISFGGGEEEKRDRKGWSRVGKKKKEGERFPTIQRGNFINTKSLNQKKDSRKKKKSNVPRAINRSKFHKEREVRGTGISGKKVRTELELGAKGQGSISLKGGGGKKKRLELQGAPGRRTGWFKLN